MSFERFTKKNININYLLLILYVAWNLFIGGMNTEHYALVVLWFTAFYATEKSRRFILGFSIFIVYWIVYDAMRILPNYEVNYVHIIEPYQLEKAWFGISSLNGILTPNEYLSSISNSFLDLMSGLFYINWVPIPLAFGVYLFIKDKTLFLKFSMAFLLVNLVGFAIYYIYPAAPPWYVDLYGFDLQVGVPGNRAGLARFDELVGFPIFESIYNKNANVLAAMPSLHSTYPLIVLFFGFKKRMGWINLFFVIFMLGIWFSAVYSNHHYILDVIVGVGMTIIVLGLFDWLSNKGGIQKWIFNFSQKI